MNRVVILGAGAVGKAAAEYVNKLSEPCEIILADINTDRASNIVKDFGDLAKAMHVDIANPATLKSVVMGADYVLNCIGPYFLHAKTVFKASIQANAVYIDVNDDWEPTLELLQNNQELEQNRQTALIGVGASPGIANMLAKLVMSELPDAKKLVTAWREDNPSSGYSAAKEHWLHQCSGLIKVVKDGKLQDQKPLQPIEIHFPEHGNIELFTVGHPEPVTLFDYYPTLESCVNAMAVPKGVINTLKRIQSDIDGRLINVAEATHGYDSYKRNEEDMTSVGLPGLFAQAESTSGETVTAVLTAFPDGMGPITAAPMVAALLLAIRGKLKKYGVLTPEEAFEPTSFLKAFEEVSAVDSPCWELFK